MGWKSIVDYISHDYATTVAFSKHYPDLIAGYIQNIIPLYRILSSFDDFPMISHFPLPEGNPINIPSNLHLSHSSSNKSLGKSHQITVKSHQITVKTHQITRKNHQILKNPIKSL